MQNNEWQRWVKKNCTPKSEIVKIFFLEEKPVGNSRYRNIMKAKKLVKKVFNMQEDKKASKLVKDIKLMQFNPVDLKGIPLWGFSTPSTGQLNNKAR